MRASLCTAALWLAGAALVSAPSARAGEVYDPGEGALGTLLFEDLWPCNGDRDFNDLVLRYNVRRAVDGLGQTTSVVVTLDVDAVGASLCGGLALRLPVPPGSVASISRRLGTAGAAGGVPWDDAEPWSLDDPQQVTASGGDVVIWLTDDLRGELCGGADGFLNTEMPPAGLVACRPAVFDVTFTATVALPPAEPYDLFLFRCDDRTHQVHRSIHPGLDAGDPFAADPALTGSCDDLDDGRNYVSVAPAGLPFVLNLGEGNGAEATAPAVFPSEHTPIERAFPDILEFADGPDDGVPAYDFYLTGDALHQYTGALPPAVIPPASAFDADGDGYCEGFDHDGLPGTAPVCFTAATADGDCDDATVVRSPGLPEVCNGVDTDCDGLVDNHPSCVPTITGIEGDGSLTPVDDVAGLTAGIGDAVHSAHRFAERWVVTGTHLDDVTQLTLASTTGGPTFTEADGLQFEPGGTPMTRTLSLPPALVAGGFLLTLTAPTGSAYAQTFILQGEPGLACWDDNGNDACDPAEDVDGSGICDTADCRMGASGVLAAYDLGGARWTGIPGTTWSSGTYTYQAATQAMRMTGWSQYIGPIVTFSLLSSGQLPTGTAVVVHAETSYRCNTADCDTGFRVTDGTGKWCALVPGDGTQLWAYMDGWSSELNVGGTYSSDSDRAVVFDFHVDGAASTLVEVSSKGGFYRGSWSCPRGLDVGTGLTASLVGGHATEVYDTTSIRVSASLATP